MGPPTAGTVALRLLAAASLLAPFFPAGAAPPAEPAGDCPPGTRLRESRPPAAAEKWCERRVAGKGWVRHGPFVSLGSDGRTQRQGNYLDGRVHGCWVQWDATGGRRDEHWWHGRTGREIADAEGLCPAGSTRVRVGWVNGRLTDECLALDSSGNPIQEGPTTVYEGARSFDERPSCRVFATPPELGTEPQPEPQPESLWVLERTDHRAGERHGLHRRWRAPGRLELEESWQAGQLEGPAASWYADGSPREQLTYRAGQIHGVRTFHYPGGQPRWHALYERGELRAREGDLTVLGEPCPEATLPVTAADGLSEACERLSGSWAVRHGPFVEWDEAGEVRERGVYEEGEKASLWQRPPATERAAHDAPAESDGGALAAEGTVTFAGRALPEWTDRPPTFWLRDEERGSQVRPEVRYADGRVAIYGLPAGFYFLNVSVDADEANDAAFPGDYEANARFFVERDEVAKLDLGLHRLLHLVEPADNGREIPSWGAECGAEPLLAGPVRFAWEPLSGLGEGVEYRYRVVRLACAPFRVMETLAEGSTLGAAVAIELPRSAPGEAYYFEIAAFHDGRRVGGFMTHGENGHGWDYRFRVR